MSYMPRKAMPLQAVRKGIEFREVSFRCSEDSADALVYRSFEIPAGVTTALIGASGAGKTAIVNLLLRPPA